MHLLRKSVSTNWLVTIHQDLSIPVGKPVHHAELSGWSEKEDALYVQPPVELLQELVAIRLNLDACGEHDGSLRVVPGSHVMGRLSPDLARSIRDDCGEVACPALRGSAMAMRPLLLHASSKARGASKRRVLHVLFGPRSLPYGLQWQHSA
ncbi:phytanoyl-CoA dioxygenase family protein [Xanthomonas oryzae]|uniref:phytanoyl-CoA dioxygenase family protein n=1 Tax=Xanthomonas oryzae TaxID=347 RepID=UPI00227D8ABA|nr:phytanoyl-CoA dioxygenase family protein [Xanthomonas oryzae]